APVESEDLQIRGKERGGKERGGKEQGSKQQVDAEDTDISMADASRFFDEDETVLLTDDDVSEFMGGAGSLIERSKPPEQPEKLPHEEGLSARRAVEGDTIIETDDSLPSEITGDDGPTGGAAGEDYSISLFDGDYADRNVETDQSELNLVDQTSTQNTAGDYSISLFDEDVTPLAPRVSKSDDSSQEDNTDPGLSLADKTGLRSLTLIDISESSLQDDLTSSEITQPSLSTTDLDSPSKTVTRQDSTSTQTYAADNYDRTLQRPDAKDGSNIFTGMKSESGDILSAEHAKKIFRSKASSQRTSNLKVYSGLVAVILVVFVGLGITQLEQNAENIETRLRPLKNDPMPGLIKKADDQGFTDIFANSPGAEIDARALELVENAEMIAGVEEVVIDSGVDETSMAETETIETTESPQKQPGSAGSDEVQQLAVTSNETGIENIISNLGNDQSEDRSPGILQITSKSSITEKDHLLQEAYAAYQRGNDDLAMLKYNQVLDIDPGSRNALLARAAISIQNGNIETAIQDYQTLLVSNPKDSLAMSSMTAVANYSPEQSESLLKLLIRDEPDSPYLNFALGNVYVAQNRWSEAQGQYFTAFQNNPGDPNYAYNLAVSLEHINQPRVAISYYQRALDNFNNGLATFNRDVVDQRLEMLIQK
ncbi:MAG: tetratricopeptide repeat protein, partial [Gammaproteobacteria bacterium]